MDNTFTSLTIGLYLAIGYWKFQGVLEKWEQKKDTLELSSQEKIAANLFSDSAWAWRLLFFFYLIFWLPLEVYFFSEKLFRKSRGKRSRG